jgi:predicted AlkP superfamily phosphohydrolase/phosphomutase
MTGRSPGHHGIFDFVRVEAEGDYPQFRLATSGDIRCQTIWSLLSERGLRCLSLNFPVMFPARPISGCLLPGFVPRRHLARAGYPPDLGARLRKVPGLVFEDLAVDFEDERRSVQVLETERMEEWIRFHIRREKQWSIALRHLMETEPWDLAAVVFDGADKIQHACWRFLDESLWNEASASAAEAKIRRLCLDYYRQLDELVAGAIRTAGPDTNVFIVSDHGFGASDEIFYVNEWLSRAGHLRWRDDAPFAEDDYINTEGMKAPAFQFDWERTFAYTLTPGSNGIYLRSGPQGETDPGPRRDRIIEGLLELRNGAGQPVVRRAMRREDVFPGPHSRLGADLTLVLRDFGFVSVLRSEVVVRPRRVISGTHKPEGIFLASGPDIRPGIRLPDLSILDVTPALLYSLRTSIPQAMEGSLPESAFRPSVLADRPPEEEMEGVGARDAEGPEYDSGPGEDAQMDPESEAQVLARLRALGYIE